MWRWINQQDTSVGQRKFWLRIFLCPTLMSCWLIDLRFLIIGHLYGTNIAITCQTVVVFILRSIAGRKVLETVASLFEYNLILLQMWTGLIAFDLRRTLRNLWKFRDSILGFPCNQGKSSANIVFCCWAMYHFSAILNGIMLVCMLLPTSWVMYQLCKSFL